ncbi:phenylalanine--tRNA ligase subunit beta [Georgenia sp. TF02-10]|uniref:phenylalanine--tRNA ligase subunit beta n=1 Tax=Georgenia sp. TF02-10 TaxID=2917725 RepID=UPI001FA7BC89|nr:phenylalanine--tRNA ligase subunit beta [Georgenia sp. TF02-10]UNX56021.1 phenylalanine--tRNA ligase subunit beta [Georgenia sp. TF02-10]
MPYVPLGWLAEHVAVPPGTTAAQLAANLVRVGLEEERIVPPAVTGPLVVGQVLTAVAEEHSNGKTIRYCRVDVGPEHNRPPGTGKEPAEVPSRGIVCGADNFAPGDHVVVALPGSVLPGPFPITARRTYGHVSDGMICSARELGLGEDHSGIIVLEQLLGPGAVPAPGTDAVALLGLGEEVLEINVTPDRGYCFAMRGVAREYSHATGAAFTDPGLPENLPAPPPAATAGGFAVAVDDDAAPVGCDRFVTRIVRGLDPTARTPRWMAQRLTQAGMRPISLAVDVTNYVMLDLGQPLHAYDLATLAAPVVVRRAAAGERLTTLDDVDRALDPADLLITDSPDGARGARVLGLAGVMGGAGTEVSAGTTDVLVEAAHFDPVSVARTARRHRLPTEAAKRFERGVDPRLPAVAAQRVVDLLVEHGGGTADPGVTDLDATTDPAPVTLDPALPGRLVGVDYPRAQVLDLLRQVGCTELPAGAGPAAGGPPDGGLAAVGLGEGDRADDAAATVRLRPPSWRPDLTGPADLAEEVARLAGYDQIPAVLPAAPAGRGLTPEQRGRRDVARALAEHGLTEVLSYPFVGDVHDRLGLPAEDPRRAVLRLVNPLAEDAGALRTSVLDTLLETARRNTGRGTTDLAVFEIGLVTRPAGLRAAAAPGVDRRPTDAELAALHAAVPAQPRHLAGVLAGQRVPAGVWGPGRAADWADAVDAVRTAAAAAGTEVRVRRGDLAPWHPGRCAEVLGPAGQVLGHAGELHPKVTAALELPPRTVAFEVDLDALLAAAPAEPVQVAPVSTFPLAKEDVALVVDDGVPAADVEAAVRAGAGDLAEEVHLFDVYTGDQLPAGKKSLAFALRLRAGDRTLTAAETAEVRARVVQVAGERVGAVLRG